MTENPQPSTDELVRSVDCHVDALVRLRDALRRRGWDVAIDAGMAGVSVEVRKIVRRTLTR